VRITPTLLSCALGLKGDWAVKWSPYLEKACALYDINTPMRICGFLAQVAHESGFFTVLRENMNYSAAGLLGTWPKRFTAATAEKYAKQPEKIANLVYANRMGNGPPESGDGWAYRGGGCLQLTGRADFRDFGAAAEVDLLGNPERIIEPELAAWSAAWEWDRGKLNAVAEAGDLVRMTKIINGGTIGLEDGNTQGRDDRTEIYQQAVAALC